MLNARYWSGEVCFELCYYRQWSMVFVKHHYISFTLTPQLGLLIWFDWVTRKHDNKSYQHGKNTCSLLKPKTATCKLTLCTKNINTIMNTMMWWVIDLWWEKTHPSTPALFWSRIERKGPLQRGRSSFENNFGKDNSVSIYMYVLFGIYIHWCAHNSF